MPLKSNILTSNASQMTMLSAYKPLTSKFVSVSTASSYTDPLFANDNLVWRIKPWDDTICISIEDKSAVYIIHGHGW